MSGKAQETKKDESPARRREPNKKAPAEAPAGPSAATAPAMSGQEQVRREYGGVNGILKKTGSGEAPAAPAAPAAPKAPAQAPKAPAQAPKAPAQAPKAPAQAPQAPATAPTTSAPSRRRGGESPEKPGDD